MLDLLAAVVVSQPGPFTPEFGLVPGERYEFRVERTRAQAGRPAVRAETVLSIEFLPVDPLAKERYVLRTTTDAMGAVSDEGRAMLGLTEDDLRVTLDMVFDGYLQFYDAPGWRRTRDAMLGMTDRILATRMGAGQVTPEQSAKVREVALLMCGTRDAVLMMSLRNVWPWFAGYTHWDLTEEAQEYADVLPGVIGGMDLPAISSVRLDDDPQTPDLVEFRMDQRVDAASLGAFIEEVIARLGPQGAAARSTIEDLELIDTLVWSYNPETALIERTVHDRVVRSGGQERRERTEWVLVEVVPGEAARHPLGKDVESP